MRTSQFTALMLVVFLGPGCQTTNVEKELNWYQQQLQTSEEERNRLELQLATCERSQQEMVDGAGRLQRELADANSMRANLESAREALLNARPEPAVAREEVDLSSFQGIEGVSATTDDEGGVRITLEQRVFFTPGSSEVRKAGSQTLQKCAEILARDYSGREVRVEGHTDNTPVVKSKVKFPSNWELSSARACAVLRALIDANAVDPNTASAIGFGAERPIADNSTKEGKSQNRRVEIRVLQ